MEMKPESAASPDALHESIVSRVEKAEQNPIAEERLVELESQLRSLKEKFIERGVHDTADSAQEESIKAEVLRSSALVDTLPEFADVLRVVAEKHDLGTEWVQDTLAHENAHANILERDGHTWVGYATLFIKRADNNGLSFHPLCLTEPNKAWGPKEMLTKVIEATKAPEAYGNALSEGDIENIHEDTAYLKKIEANEDARQQRIAEISTELERIESGR